MEANDTQTTYESQMAAAASDLQLLRRQARQRFVGAAVLVLIAVVALPFVLDTKPRPVASDIAIDIQAPVAAPVLDVPKPAAPAPTTPPEPALPTVAEKPVPAVPALAASSAPVITPSPVQATPAVGSKPEPAKPDTTKTDDGARAAALLNGVGYQIQAGSFTDKTKLAEVQAKLEKAGFPNFTQDAIARDGTAHTRIRLGPYPTQAEANNVAARIGKLGIKTLVIKP